MHSSSTARFLLSAAVAGVISTIAFTALHQWLISDIWFALIPMLIAGALCGICVAWSYRLLFRSPRPATWWSYNLLYVALIGLLGIVSMIIFEPVTTVAALLEAGGAPPPELLLKAAPLTAGYTLASAVLIHLIWGRGAAQFAVVLLTCTVVILLLGVNLSILGLVAMTMSAYLLVGAMIGLTLFLNVCFAAAFMGLEWKAFRSHSPAPPAAIEESVPA